MERNEELGFRAQGEINARDLSAMSVRIYSINYLHVHLVSTDDRVV